MAAGHLPLPGSKFGHCLDGCDHIDCNQTRTMAETICHYCEKAIGYDRGFYMLDEKKIVHSSCHEDAFEKERLRKPFSTMTYQDYLSNWESQFGDDDTAEYGYYSHGVHTSIEVHRLSEAEFNEHLSGLNKAQESFDIALKANDDNGMGNALSESFPHELVLLI